MHVNNVCCPFCSEGQALEKAGGKEFKKELDDLSKANGNLDTAGGKILLFHFSL